MKRLVFFFFLAGLLVSMPAFAKPVKVLMIGNSFSVCNMRYMPSVAASLGKELDLVSAYLGGCSFKMHAENIAKEETDETYARYVIDASYCKIPEFEKTPVFKALIPVKREGHWSSVTKILQADKWDVVTIQQASPCSWSYDEYRPYADKVIDTIRKYAPQAEIIIQQTWSYSNADMRVGTAGEKPTWGFDRDGMYERLTQCYARLARDFKLRVIPMGYAVELYRKRLPVTFAPVFSGKVHRCEKKFLFDDIIGDITYREQKDRDGKFTGYMMWGDTIHLNRRGEFLQACVWTSFIFNTDVSGLKYIPGKSKEEIQDTTPEQYALMRKCANDAVREFPGMLKQIQEKLDK